MSPALIQILFTQILLPELGRWLARRGSDAPFPTTEALLAELNRNATAVIAAGEDFLREKGAL